jgi:hypothetical protein
MRLTTCIALLCIGLACGPAAAEPSIPAAAYPALPRHVKTAEDIVPTGWGIESKVAGDLNSDGRDDFVLVLRARDPRNVVDMREQGGPEHYDTNPRILAVAFANAAGGYDLALENHTLIMRTTEPSAQDPLDQNGVQPGGVEIKSQTLKVTLGYFSGNMGHATYTFRYQSGRFALIGYDGIDVDRFKGDMRDISINYVTRRKEVSLGKISDEENKVRRTALPRRPLLTIEQIGDGLDFDASPK